MLQTPFILRGPFFDLAISALVFYGGVAAKPW
jgi:hypothetical protein